MYIEQLDIPPLPDEVVEDLLQTNPETEEFLYKFEFDEEDQATFKIYQVYMDKVTSPWWKDTGLDKYDWHIQTVRSGHHLIPHRDDQRDFVFMYVIDTGGPAVRTCFYKQLLDKEYPPTVEIPRDEIELDYEIVMEKGKWYKMNVQAIHSVENLESTRMCLSRHIPEQGVDYGSKFGIVHKRYNPVKSA